MQNVFHSHFPSRCLFVVAALFSSFVTQLSAQNMSCSVANKVYVAPGQLGQARVLLNSWDRKSVVDRVGYALTIDGVTRQERILELKKPLTYDEAAQMTIEVPPAAHPGVDDFSVTILTVNGKPNRNSFPTSGSQRYTLTRPVFRKAVVEDLTGMWCPNCPPGIASLEHLNRVAADRYIGLAAHDGDALGTADYYEVFRLFPGRPKIVLNGSHNVSPYFGNSGTEEQSFGLLADVQQASGAQTAVQLKVQAAWSADRKSVDVRSATVYRCPVAKNKYRLAYVLTADSLKHPSFVQFNNAAGDPIWEKSVPEMQIFYHGTGEMRGLSYNDVVLSAAGVRYGIAGSLPERMQLDTLYEHSHRFGNLGQSKGYRYVKQNRNLHVVALLIDPQTREIVNAERCAVGDQLQPFPVDSAPVPDVQQIVLPDSVKPHVDSVFTLHPQLLPAEAKSRLVWEVADTSVVATVSVGQFRAVRAGETIITVRADDAHALVARCVVRVSAPTAVDRPAMVTTVQREGDMLVVQGAPAGRRVEVYDLAGRRKVVARTQGGVTRLRVGRSPLWIVVVGNRRFNVVD